jgi:hypothetical protein
MPFPLHLFALVVAAFAPGRAEPCSTDPRVWCPAEYRGLIMGRATVDDALRTLGTPLATVEASGEDSLTWLGFEAAGEIPGKVNVWADARTRVVTMVVVHPAGISRQAALRHFGAGFVETRYAPDECAVGEVVPLHESPGGPILQVEYRNRGIALSLTDAGEVHEVLYLSRPVSAPRSSCAPGARATR